MNGRTFVLVFCFWAFLTIITPTLIHLSASAKPNLDSQGGVSDGLKARRMMPYLDIHKRNSPLAPAPAPAPAAASAPEPVLAPEAGDGENASPERAFPSQRSRLKRTRGATETFRKDEMKGYSRMGGFPLHLEKKAK